MAINTTVENINNQPTIQPQTVTGIFTKYIAKTLPLAFDESMSYYECLCALLEYLNETIVPDINNTNAGLSELQGFYLDLQNYVNNYFDNLDVQEEINNKLDDMTEDGTLGVIIDQVVLPRFQAINAEIEEFEDDVNNQIQQQNTRIAASNSGSPLVASSTSDMTDTTRVYVNTTDGKWYYYDGDSWEIGGTYQSAKVSDNGLLFNMLSNDIQNFFGREFDDPETITWEENTYYKWWNGEKASTTYANSVAINVTPGDIYHIKGVGTSSGTVLYMIKGSGSVLYYSPVDDNAINTDIIIPNNADTLCINYVKALNEPVLQEFNKFILNKNSRDYVQNTINDNISEINNGILVLNPQNLHIGYFRPVFIQIPSTKLAISAGDSLTFKFKFKTDYIDKIVRAVYREDGNTSPMYEPTIDTEKGTLTVDVEAYSVEPSYDIFFGIEFEDVGTESYLAYDLELINNTTSTTLTDFTDCVTTDLQVQFPYYYSAIYEKNKKVLGSVGNNDLTKVVYCGGDSLTAANPNQNGSTWVTQLRLLYPDATIINHAVGGSTAKDLVHQLTDVERGSSQTVRDPDYSNCQAVFINIGTNYQANGTLESSIPQIANATDLNDEPLVNMDVDMAVNTGFKYNGNVIDSADDYWNLFSNNNYGNIGLVIEYIQSKNPKTQIFLCPPPVMPDRAMTAPNSAWTLSEIFKELAHFYGVNYIDTISGMNINQKNSYHFTYDGVHGLPIRDEMYGQYVAKQCRNKIIDE